MTFPTSHPLHADPAVFPAASAQDKVRVPLGKMLVDRGYLAPENLIKAIAIQAREEARFGDILLAHDMVREDDLYRTLADQYGAVVADLRTNPPDVRLIDAVGAARCLRDGMLPWRRVGGATIVACCRPELFDSYRASLPKSFGKVRMAVVSETDLHRALMLARQRRLARYAERRVPSHESCRDWNVRPFVAVALAAVIAGIALAVTMPHILFAILCGWAVLTLLASSFLKLGAAIAQTRWADQNAPGPVPSGAAAPMKMPVVSVMVPLFKERAVAERLIKRLSRISYPKELLDILLVVEEDDIITQEAIRATHLPRWMRQVIVPRGAVQTKPRALNFALDFCRGTIIGVYDAEDAPEPDQIHKVVRRFHVSGPEVACLQGILDFYNARHNWLARCFTIEYATWFRLVLPGLERMGLAVPLGGTTLFFRRDALEFLGGWDAHNVTEDADLGIRLARHGYRTELIPTVTDEEANCRVWPWVRQRSRWLKGYGMTWAVHMRTPRRLLRELGAWKFFGVQLLFLGTLSQFVLAPILWTFWSIPLGLGHPLQNLIPGHGFIVLGTVFFLTEILSIWIGVLAVSRPKHKGMWIWVPTMHFYFPLGSLAAYKGIWEIATRPFYWDKTAHGVTEAHDDDENDDVPLGDVGTPRPA